MKAVLNRQAKENLERRLHAAGAYLLLVAQWVVSTLGTTKADRKPVSYVPGPCAEPGRMPDRVTLGAREGAR